MRIDLFFRGFVKLLITGYFGLVLGGCSSLIKPQKTYTLQLSGVVGQKEKTYWHTEISTTRKGTDSISRSQIEKMDFQTLVETTELTPQSIKQTHQVVEKIGDLDLKEMAFPDFGEKLKTEYSRKAEVIRSGDYEKNSVFFVPSISLPSKPVAVGDSWEMVHEWVDAKTSIAMKISLESRLKKVFPCGEQNCFDIEVEGEVVVPQLSTAIKIESAIWGRIFFMETSGAVLWSEIRNREKLLIGPDEVLVETCLESVSVEPKKPGLMQRKPQCQAPFEDEIQVPIIPHSISPK